MPSNESILRPISITRRHEYALILALFALHAIVFVLIAALIPTWIAGDSSRYFDLSRSLTQGQFGLMTPGGFEPEGMRSVAYPVFVLMCDILPGAAELNVVIVQGVLYLLSILLIWKLVKRTFGKPVSYVFLILLLFYPFIAYSSCLVSPEGPAIFLLAAAASMLDVAMRKEHVLAGFAATGLMLGLASHFRSNLFPLAFFLGLIILLIYKKKKTVLLLPAAAALIIIPQVIYNYHYFQSLNPTPIYAGAQTSLWMATWHARVSTDAMLKYRRNDITPEFESSGMLEQMAEINRTIGVREDFYPINMGYYENNSVRARVLEAYGKSAVKNIEETPGTYLSGSFMNAFRMWFSAYLSYAGIPVYLQYYLLFVGLFVFLAGIAGMMLLMKESQLISSPFVLFALGTIVFHSITLCWSHTEARYTIPARLFLTAFAAFAVYACFEFSVKNLRKAAVPARIID